MNKPNVILIILGILLPENLTFAVIPLIFLVSLFCFFFVNKLNDYLQMSHDKNFLTIIIEKPDFIVNKINKNINNRNIKISILLLLLLFESQDITDDLVIKYSLCLSTNQSVVANRVYV